jgi:hypothetical protein
MKKLAFAAFLVFTLLAFACTGNKDGGAKFHIGILTETVSQAEDDLRGAEELIRLYGRVSEGGMIQHVTYPDNFMDQQETFISQVVAMADDPLMKAIIINNAIPGTAEAFRRVKEKRPDIICIAAEAHEDPLVIQQSADIAINVDFVSRGYLIPWAAKELGAKTFVHISFPRHMSYESLGLRRQIMEEACKDLGIEFVFFSAPDPTSDVGVSGAQQFILEQIPSLIQQYGPETAFFCTNDAHTEPLLTMLLQHGGMFVEADLPSPLMGYPGALGLDLSSEIGNFPAILKKVEEAVVAKGGAGKFGTWAFSNGFSQSAGWGEYAKRVVEGKATLGNLDDMWAALAEFTPGVKWNGAYYVDANTGIRAKNHLLVYMDTYIMGSPGRYLPTTEQVIPEKYYAIKFQGN